MDTKADGVPLNALILDPRTCVDIVMSAVLLFLLLLLIYVLRSCGDRLLGAALQIAGVHLSEDRRRRSGVAALCGGIP